MQCSGTRFLVAIWKQDKLKADIDNLADRWGIDREWLFKSVNAFSGAQPELIPYIDELPQSVNYEVAMDKSVGNQLKHMMTLTRKLSELIAEMIPKYL